MNSVGLRLQITGVVQGVGYRYYCYQKASQLELSGWVRNRPGGMVEVLAEGNRGALEILIEELKVGPSMADVRHIEIEWLKFTGDHTSFNVTG